MASWRKDREGRDRARASILPGTGLPAPLFLQDRLPSSLEPSERVRPPPLPPAPGTYSVPSGGLTPGLRAPFDGHDAAPEQATLFQTLTHFDPTWGIPPPIPGLSWNPERALYERDAGTPGDRALLSNIERRATDRVFMQAYPSVDDVTGWRFRWVRAQTNAPQAGAPYTLLGDVENLDDRPQGAPAATGNLLRQVALNDALAASAAKQRGAFDESLYQYVGVRHTGGGGDRMVYHLEPRKDLPPERQEELWEVLCSPETPAQHRLSAEDCQVRKWFRESEKKMRSAGKS